MFQTPSNMYRAGQIVAQIEYERKRTNEFMSLGLDYVSGFLDRGGFISNRLSYLKLTLKSVDVECAKKAYKMLVDGRKITPEEQFEQECDQGLHQ
jgi:hypothetical protein